MRVQSSELTIRGVVFDYGFTLSSDLYFNVAPEGVDNWQCLLRDVVFQDPVVRDPWMRGQIGLNTIAQLIAEQLTCSPDAVLRTMKLGCARLRENVAVKELAVNLKTKGVPIALVTANFDVFNEVVVPAHRYDELFNVIVNSSDYGTTDKRQLWPIAFARMGSELGYHNTLLIEDGEKEPQAFRDCGGEAIQYAGDDQMRSEVARYSFVR